MRTAMFLLVVALAAFAVGVVPGEAAAHECPSGSRVDFYTPFALGAGGSDGDGGYLHVCL